MKKHATAWIKGLLKYGIGFGLLAWVISKYWDDNETTHTPGLHTLLNGEIDYIWLLVARCCLAAGSASRSSAGTSSSARSTCPSASTTRSASAWSACSQHVPPRRRSAATS